MTYVQRASRVGGYKFNLNFFAFSNAGTTKVFLLRQDHFDYVLRSIRGNKKVDETGAGDFSFIQLVVFGQGVTNRLRQIARRLARHFRQSQGNIAGEITVRGIFGAGNLNGGRNGIVERAVANQGVDCLSDQVFNFMFQVIASRALRDGQFYTLMACCVSNRR